MSLFKKKEEKPNNYELARKRIGRLTSSEVLDWADQVGSGLALALQDYRRAGTPESLEEANWGMDALQAVVDELTFRETGQG